MFGNVYHNKTADDKEQRNTGRSRIEKIIKFLLERLILSNNVFQMINCNSKCRSSSQNLYTVNFGLKRIAYRLRLLIHSVK